MEKEASKDVDTKSDDPVGLSSYDHFVDHDSDDYAVNSNVIHGEVDRRSLRGDLDLYDVFKDFDRDGDGIVDDIDFDDPNWISSCKKNNIDIYGYDDAYFRAGRYRGLTEEEWSSRELQHQRNLEQLEKK